MPKQIFIRRNQMYNSETQDIVQISSDPGWSYFLVPNEEDVWVIINGVTFSMKHLNEANNKITELEEQIKELEQKNKDLQEKVRDLRMYKWIV